MSASTKSAPFFFSLFFRRADSDARRMSPPPVSARSSAPPVARASPPRTVSRRSRTPSFSAPKLITPKSGRDAVRGRRQCDSLPTSATSAPPHRKIHDPHARLETHEHSFSTPNVLESASGRQE